MLNLESRTSANSNAYQHILGKIKIFVVAATMLIKTHFTNECDCQNEYMYF